MKIASLIIVFFLLGACSSKPYEVDYTEMPPAEGQKEAYVVRHGWHTGIVIPAQKIQEQLPELKVRFGDIPFIEFGWGDKDYYQAQEPTIGMALKAIFWPTETVIHAVAVPDKPDNFFSNNVVKKLCISSRGYSSLVRYISESFYKNEHGKLLKLRKGLYGDSQFYKGVGHFYFMNTCNTWTAKGLKSAGLDISPTFKITAGSIIDFLQKHEKSVTKKSSTEQSKTRALRAASFESQSHQCK